MQMQEKIRDKNGNELKVGDYAIVESFSGQIIAGVVTVISDRRIGIENTKLHYARKHKEVEKITQDEYMLYKLES